MHQREEQFSREMRVFIEMTQVIRKRGELSTPWPIVRKEIDQKHTNSVTKHRERKSLGKKLRIQDQLERQMKEREIKAEMESKLREQVLKPLEEECKEKERKIRADQGKCTEQEHQVKRKPEQ